MTKYMERKASAGLLWIEARAMLAAHEREYQVAWDAAPNPFVSISDYVHPAARAEREAVLAPYFAARERAKRFGVNT